VEARAGPFQVASTHGDGYVLPRTRHPMMMMKWVRSFSTMLPSVKFTEDKVLIFFILREKC